MFASNFCAHFVLVTISDLKIKLHISYIVLIVGNVFCSFFIKVMFECIIKGRKVFLFLYIFWCYKEQKIGLMDSPYMKRGSFLHVKCWEADCVNELLLLIGLYSSLQLENFQIKESKLLFCQIQMQFWL